MKKTLLWAGLLVGAALLGGAKAGVDYWLQWQLRDAANTLPVQTTFTTAQLTWHNTLHIAQAQLNNPPWPGLMADAVVVKNIHQFALQAPLPVELTAHAEQFGLQWHPSTDRQTPGLVTLLGYGPYYLSGPEIASLGIHQLRGPLETHAKFQAQTGQIHLTFAWSLPQLLTLAGQITVSNAQHWPLRQALTSLKLNSAEFTLRGEGVARVFAYLAQRAKLSPDTWAQQLIAKLSQDLRLAGIQITAEDWQAVAQFFAQGQYLAFHFAPATPLSLERLARMSPQQGIDSLQFHLRASLSSP